MIKYNNVITHKNRMTMKQLIISLFALLSVATSQAQLSEVYDFTVGGIYYSITSTGDLTVSVCPGTKWISTSRTDYQGDITIPDTVVNAGKTYRVTAIKSGTFQDCLQLTSLSIPANVVSFGSNFRYDTPALAAITVDENNIACVCVGEALGNKGLNALTGYATGKGSH